MTKKENSKIIKNNNSMRDSKEYFDSMASSRSKWRKKGRYYYKNLEKYIRFLIPEGSSVLEIGLSCGKKEVSGSPCGIQPQDEDWVGAIFVGDVC